MSSQTNIDGDLSITGNLQINGDVNANGDVSDGGGSLQQNRDIYNGHTHVTPQGTTQAPSQRQ